VAGDAKCLTKNEGVAAGENLDPVPRKKELLAKALVEKAGILADIGGDRARRDKPASAAH
jgi:hypothetical protein